MNKSFFSPKYQTVDDYEDKAKKQFSLCLTFLQSHITLAMTLVYLLVSSFGLVYIYALMGHFKIDILPHLEISDFILAAIHYPTSFIFIFISGIAYWLFMKLDILMRKIKVYDRWNNLLSRPMMIFNPIYVYSLALVCIIFTVNIFSAEKSFNDINTLKTQIYTVMLMNEVELAKEKHTKLENVQIVADTVKYLWVYLNDSQKVHAIPHKNINVLIPTFVKDKTSRNQPSKSK